MRKKSLVFAVLMLTYMILAGAAFADVYMNTSDIPMARTFSVEVVFDAQGYPKILTDYPYAETGAKELNLVFNKGEFYEAATVQYSFVTGETEIRGFNSRIYDSSNIDRAIADDIRSGVLTMDDNVFINTNRNSAETDWILEYAVSRNEYVSYKERTHSQGFNAMGAGGYDKTFDYEAGELYDAFIQKRIDNADLVLHYSRAGELQGAYVITFQGNHYSYDPVTGLFDGRTLTELGFEESDIRLSPFTEIGAEVLTGQSSEVHTVVSEPDSVPVTVTRGNAATTIVGGLLSGILIGLTLFRMFRRRKEETKPVPAEETAGSDENEPSEAPSRHMDA